MKRRSVFTSLLAICLCLCFLLTSCNSGSTQGSGGSQDKTNDSTDTSLSDVNGSKDSGADDSKAPDSGTTDSKAPSSDITSESGSGMEDIPDPPDETIKWRGQTLNVLATPWQTGNAAAPWAQVELTVDPEDPHSTAGYGQIINLATIKRADEIKDVYGVEINWINARSSMISNMLKEAVASGAQEKYHIAMPRALEAQTIVATNSIYDLANRKYINLDSSYYNQVAREAYTVNGHTLFVAGDFSFLDESSAFVTYYNVAMAEGFESFPDVYQLVREGNWTIDQMVNIAKLVYKNSNEAEWTDDDTYGFGTVSLPSFYQYSGIQQVSLVDGEYAVTLDDPKLNTLIDKILEITGADWARTEWTGGESAVVTAFADSRLFFYNDSLQKLDCFGEQREDFKVGVLPVPKLNESQEKYYTSCTSASTLMCVPKSTPDREMSDFFVEVLSYTGQKYIMSAFGESLRTKLDPETAIQSMKMIEDYIFEGIVYDQGYLYGMDGLLTEAQEATYKYAGSSFNRYDYAGELEKAAEAVAEWNLSWKAYTE